MESYINSVKDRPIDIHNYVEFNYNFHHKITIASGNIVYAMIFKSFELVCKNLIRLYFESGDYYKKSLDSHIDLYQAIKEQQPQRAGNLMKEILMKGRNKLEKAAVE